MKNRVGIFGGSFNPVHSGHIKVAESFLNSNIIDQLLLLLTPNPPHKNSENQLPFTHRFEMLKLAFQNYDRVSVSDLERELPSPSYTLQTIRHLQKEYPETSFFLCIGEDSLQEFHMWYKYDEILKLVPLIVAERPGYDSSVIQDQILERAIFVEHKPVDVSSTEIRNTDGGGKPDENIPSQVLEYINKHNLYR